MTALQAIATGSELLFYYGSFCPDDAYTAYGKPPTIPDASHHRSRTAQRSKTQQRATPRHATHATRAHARALCPLCPLRYPTPSSVPLPFPPRCPTLPRAPHPLHPSPSPRYPLPPLPSVFRRLRAALCAPRPLRPPPRRNEIQSRRPRQGRRRGRWKSR